MGHEYIEMKNSHAAIEAYRRAVGMLIAFALPVLVLPFTIPGSRCESKGLQSVVWPWTGIRAIEYASVRIALLSTCYCFAVRPSQCWKCFDSSILVGTGRTMCVCGKRRVCVMKN
jgi:hypothetical protein